MISGIIPMLMLLVITFPIQSHPKPDQASKPDDILPARDYLMISAETVRDGSAQSPKLRSVRVRFVKADGQWKQIIVSTKGKVTLHLAKPDGVYFGEPGNLYLTRDFTRPPDVFRSRKFLRSHPQFNREESLLGYKAYVIRGPSGNGAYTEMYQAPEFGFISVKTVSHFSANNESVIEPLRLDFTEITDQMLKDESLSQLSDYVTQAIKAVGEQGRKELVEGLIQIQKQLQSRAQK